LATGVTCAVSISSQKHGYPVNPSGGLSSFGEAAPAQALAQICELTWQLRGQAEKRQVEKAKVGLAINFGLAGNCSCTILKK